MMSKILFILIGLICLTNGTEDKARYDNYRVYRVHLKTDDQVKVFQEIEAHTDSMIFMGHPRDANQNLTVLVAAHKVADLTDIMDDNKINYLVLDYNFQAKIDAQDEKTKANTSGSEFEWKNYYHLETIYAWMDHLCVKYSDILNPLSVGTSYEGVQIRGVKLSHKVNNTAVFVEGGIHAREWISPATATFILNQLLTSQNESVKDIAQNFDWIFFPVINPDGYKATFEKDRMWRKTRQPFGLCRGTDLNRNWNSAWNQTGSSPNPCAYDYAGPRVWSEREAEQLSNYLTSIVKPQMVQTYITLHSYSHMLLFPHGYTTEKVWNNDDLKAIGQKTIDAIKQRYGTVYTSGRIVSGSSHDWAYTELKIPIAYTFELRGPPNSTDMFILPADQIEPTAWETLDGFIALLNEARARGYYNVEKIYASQTSASSHLESLSMINVAVAVITACVLAY